MQDEQGSTTKDGQLQGAFERLLNLNRAALVLWVVGAGLVALGLALPYSMGIFNSTGLLAFYLIALPGTIYYFRKSSEITKSNSVNNQLKLYDKLRGSQSTLYTFITVGAFAMIPGSIIVIQMLPVGAGILVNLIGGAIIGFRLTKVHREVTFLRVSSDDPELTDAAPNIYKNAARPAPLKVKLPIWEGFVWIGGSIILGINLLIELSHFNAYRDYGILNGVPQDTSSSMWLGLSQAFDLLVLSSIGWVLLILAIINQFRVAHKKRNLAAIAIVLVGLVIFPGGISSVLAGVAGDSDYRVQITTEGKKSTAAIRDIMNSGPVPGFEGVYEESWDCEREGCSDSGMRLAKEVGPEPMTDLYCKDIVSFGVSVGMIRYATAPDYSMRHFDGYPSPAVSACVRQLDDITLAQVQQYQALSEAFILEGISASEVPIRFVLTHSIDGNLDDNPGFHTYFLEITTTYQTDDFSNPEDSLSQGTVEINDLLNLIGQQRLANPERAPMDRAFTEEILAGYPHDIELGLVENSSGEIHRIELTNSDGSTMCLSIEPWESDPFNEGIPDPGMGYGLGFMESLEVLRGFGNAVEGSCG